MHTFLFTLVFFCGYELRSSPRSVCLLICCFKFILSASLRALSIPGLLFSLFFLPISLCVFIPLSIFLSLYSSIYIYLSVCLSVIFPGYLLPSTATITTGLFLPLVPPIQTFQFSIGMLCYIMLQNKPVSREENEKKSGQTSEIYLKYECSVV